MLALRAAAAGARFAGVSHQIVCADGGENGQALRGHSAGDPNCLIRTHTHTTKNTTPAHTGSLPIVATPIPSNVSLKSFRAPNTTANYV